MYIINYIKSGTGIRIYSNKRTKMSTPFDSIFYESPKIRIFGLIYLSGVRGLTLLSFNLSTNKRGLIKSFLRQDSVCRLR